MRAKITFKIRPEFRDQIRLEEIPSPVSVKSHESGGVKIVLELSLYKQPSSEVVIPASEMGKIIDTIKYIPENGTSLRTLYITEDSDGISNGFYFTAELLQKLSECGIGLSTEVFNT